jgi:oligopeptide/dipeptide ABC transporter ATP-binding protein
MNNPLHPYTQSLLRAIPTIKKKEMPVAIPGMVPSIFESPQGCPFHPRCIRATKQCREEIPLLVEYREGQYCRCHYPGVLKKNDG